MGGYAKDVLVDTDWVADNLDNPDVRIVEVDEDTAAYERGHIYRATSLPRRLLEVRDSTADLRYLVLPRRPEGTEGWSEEELAKLVTRDSMIGVTEALSPDAVPAR